MDFYKAEIGSASDGRGYWLLSSREPYMNRFPEYVHNEKVDGNTQTGGATNCFPRRCLVGGSNWNDSNYVMQYGSRTLTCRANTAFTDAYFSIMAEVEYASSGQGYYMSIPGTGITQQSIYIIQM